MFKGLNIKKFNIGKITIQTLDFYGKNCLYIYYKTGKKCKHGFSLYKTWKYEL